MKRRSRYSTQHQPGACRLVAVILAIAAAVMLESSPAWGARETSPSFQPVEVNELRTEYASNPLGIDGLRPRLSWQLQSHLRGKMQTGYQIRVAADVGALTHGTGMIWDSKKVRSDQSTQVPYAGPPLHSRNRYYWQVRVWDEADRASAWSAPAWWEMALLQPSDWSAQWIEHRSSSPQPALLRRAFTLDNDIQRARVYVTSRGLYQLFLNGQRVGNAELTPGFTSYGKRLQYQTYDVTHLLNRGGNAIGALLGGGWYNGVLGWANTKPFYGERTALLAQLEILYTDGRLERLVTDASWKSSASPVVMSDLYQGETYDARLEQAGWSTSGFDDRHWTEVGIGNAATAMLVAQNSPPIRKTEQIVPVRVLTTKSGKTIVDMGQNMVGWARLSVSGPAGAVVTLRHGEALDADGELYTQNLSTAKQTNRYILKGDGVEIFQPHFTYQGFRYVEVADYPGPMTADKLTGMVVHSDFDPSGRLETSNVMLNQLQHNIVWSQKGNFVAIPTDNPQRFERYGWTADAQLFAPTATFNFNVAGFLANWLKDLAADQRPSGAVSWIVPDVLGAVEGKTAEYFTRVYGHQMTPPLSRATSNGPTEGAAAAVWGDAATVIPWILYQRYGDRQVLQDQYQSMTRWVSYQHQRAGDDLIWDGDFQFADWLDTLSGSRIQFGSTNADLVATAYFAHSADLVSRAAHVLGREEDVNRYAQLFSAVRSAFNRKFVRADATMESDTQTAYVLALQFGLLPDHQRAAAARHLADNVRRYGHLTTGLAGTPALLSVLSEHGYLTEAYQLLLRQDYPSWLYTVKAGATTIWERWDGVKPDGSFQDPGMNSFNQYVYGAVGDWMYRVIGGIDVDENLPGYKHITIKPQPGGGLTYATASHKTPYGEVYSSWSTRDGTFQLSVSLPPNTTADVHLPSAPISAVRESGLHISRAHGTRLLHQSESGIVVRIGSGRYEFMLPYPTNTLQPSSQRGSGSGATP